jgi:hypothetical protein
MSKRVITIGYNSSYVVDTKDAVAIMDMLGKAELYEQKYHSAEGDKPSFYTYHAWEADMNDSLRATISLLPNNVYRMAKLAGKPEERK